MLVHSMQVCVCVFPCIVNIIQTFTTKRAKLSTTNESGMKSISMRLRGAANEELTRCHDVARKVCEREPPGACVSNFGLSTGSG